jgi:tetratricopeptide (TPR) repeat protein
MPATHEAMDAVASNDSGRGSLRNLAILLLSFAILSYAIYEPALGGPFLSDDLPTILENELLRGDPISLVRDAFDPTGRFRYQLGGNYAPLSALVLGLEWRLWGDAPRPYHLVNVGLHALNAVLLVALLRGSGLGGRLALFGGLFFLVHPANVEGVAWISQVRSPLGACFAFAALLCFRRTPLLAATWFALALLTKAQAIFALPMAAGLWWSAHGRSDRTRQAKALAVWGLIVGAYLPIQLAESVYAMPRHPEDLDLVTRFRGMTAIGARYLAMAAIGYGTSAYHQPEPRVGGLDPWWLAGLLLLPILLVRAGFVLARRREEGAWWLAAAGGYLPVAQLFPFFYPMGDRYLYFVLPGLIGAVLLLSRDALGAIGGRVPGRTAAVRWLRPAGALLGLLWLGFLGQHALARAGLWQSVESLYRDSAGQYPRGSLAFRYYATLELRRGNREAALAALREFVDRDGDLVSDFTADPGLEALHEDARFLHLAGIHATKVLEDPRWADREPSTRRLLEVAEAHRMLGDYDSARAALGEASQRPDASVHQVDRWISELERQRERHEAGGEPPAGLAPCTPGQELEALRQGGLRPPCIPVP